MSDPASTTPVLIVGAGPTGLVLTFWLARLGLRPRIIDSAAEPGTTSRALVVQARTLEYYRQLGLAEAVVAAGQEFGAANLWVDGRRRARVLFGPIGQGLTPYPFMLIYPQDEHEPLLIERLAALGIAVERSTELLGFTQDEAGVTARLRLPNGREESCRAAYIAGCDGAHSQVREVIGAGFPGGTYDRRFYVADAVARGPVTDGELHLSLSANEFIGAFPMRGPGRVRIIGTIRTPEGDEPPLDWEDVSQDVLREIGVSVDRVNWFSTYRVHHRVADRFRDRRAFLLGDAAHIHSPAGGQGMNTGIADATNLGWKLAAVLQGRAQPALLDSYAPERIAFAHRLVATTDRAFTAATSPRPVARFLRRRIIPRLLAVIARSTVARRFMFRTVSQTAVEYRQSALSQGSAGKLRAGDRMPWVPATDGSDNFAPLAALDWQVHIHGHAAEPFAAACRELGLALHVFPPGAAATKAGIAADAAYLLRPDGYVGLADPAADPATLRRYIDSFGIRPRASG